MRKLQNSKCVSCGLCQGMCPTDALRLKYDTRDGIYRPNIDEKKCTKCGLCDKVCIANEYSTCYSLEGDMVGSYRRMELLSSADKLIRKNSSSGGVVNRLIKYLVETCMVDAVLMVCQKNKTKISLINIFNK